MRKLFLIFILAAIPSISFGQGTFTSASCSRADVNAVVNGPTHTAISGDTIAVSNVGSPCTWASGITVTGVGITITGTGTPNTGGGTVGAGTANTTLVNNANAPFFIFTGLVFGQTAKVELLNLNSANPATLNNVVATLEFIGTCTVSGCANIRVDNITYGTNNWNNNLNGGGFIATDNVFGVLDHNTAAEPAGTNTGAPFIQLHYSAWQGIGNFGDNSFAAADTFGTGQAMYLENNSFNFIRGTENDVSTIDGQQGGTRYVCRFNTFLNMSGTGICSAHGTGWLGRIRGHRQIEVYYNNVTTSASHGCDAVTGINSGTGYFLSNLVTTTAQGCNEFVRVEIARFIMNTAPWNSCNGTQPWDLVPFTSSSPCIDQPGRGGGGALLQASTPVLASLPGTPCSTAGQCYPAAPLDPVYEAGDTSTTANVSQGINSVSSAGHIVQNVDFYGEVSQTAQTSATSPFNGTTGTGYGLLTRRPATCTTGVGYWATDTGSWNGFNSQQGTLYKCVSTNTWSSLYVPYTYPHPLTAGTSAPIATFTPSSVNFGQVPAGLTSNPIPVTLQNTGTANLVVSTVSLGSGVFSLINNTCGSPATITNTIPGTGFTLTPGASCTFQAIYQPVVPNFTNTASVFFSPGASNPDALSLTGNSTGPSAPSIINFAGNFTSSGTVAIK